MAAKLSKDVSVIKAGLGQKYGHVIQGYSAFACGVVITMIHGWLLSLIILAIFPFLIILIMTQSTIQKKQGANIMKSYSQSAGYAEQALGSIKVVHTYGQELLEASIYSKYLGKVRD